MNAFESSGLHFAIDRVGIEVPSPDVIQTSIDYGELGIAVDDDAAELGRRLTALLGEAVEDDEGHFDFAVSKDGTVVAALVIECDADEEVLFLGGERTRDVDDDDLRAAMLTALVGVAPKDA